jgi:hypothetical protein
VLVQPPHLAVPVDVLRPLLRSGEHLHGNPNVVNEGVDALLHLLRPRARHGALHHPLVGEDDQLVPLRVVAVQVGI